MKLSHAKRSNEAADTEESSAPLESTRRRASAHRSWFREIDLSRAAENTLVGAILFFGRYPVTFCLVLFRPRTLETDLILSASYKNDAQVRFTRPVTFLVVSGFVYLAFALASTGAFMPFESVIEHFRWLIDRMPKKIEQLTFGKLAYFMIPFVLFVALYARITQTCFGLLKGKAPFKVHLNLACYIVGVVAVLLTLLAMIEPRAWDLAFGPRRNWLTALPLLLLPVSLWGLLALCLLRYLDLARRACAVGWLQALAATTLSVGVFYALSTVILFLSEPILSQLK
jgi:hypothetical protein